MRALILESFDSVPPPRGEGFVHDPGTAEAVGRGADVKALRERRRRILRRCPRERDCLA